MKIKDILKKAGDTSTKTIRGYIIAFIVRWLIYITILVIAASAAFKTVSYVSSRYACHTQWVESGIEYKYTLRGGCLLKLEKGWLPAKNFRVN